MSDRPKLQRREIMGQHLTVAPDLENKEKHGLTLTSDGKLRVDDPTTQAKIDEAIAILESASHGNAALKILIDAIEDKLDVPANFMADVSGLQTEANASTRYTNLGNALVTIDDEVAAIEVKLDTPANFMADVSALALEATLETIMGAEWTFEDLKAIYDFIGINHTLLGTVADEVAAIEVKLDTPANFKADVSGLATAAKLEDAMQKATGPAYNQDTDSLEALREAIDGITGGATAQQVWEYATRRLTNLSDVRAAKIDNVDQKFSEKLPYFVASDTLRISNDTARMYDGTTWTLLKITIPAGSGILRMKFDLKSGRSNYYAYGRIRYEGTEMGTLRSNNTTSYITYTEDLPCFVGGRLEVWGRNEGYKPVYVRRFRHYGNISTVLIYGAGLV